MSYLRACVFSILKISPPPQPQRPSTLDFSYRTPPSTQKYVLIDRGYLKLPPSKERLENRLVLAVRTRFTPYLGSESSFGQKKASVCVDCLGPCVRQGKVNLKVSIFMPRRRFSAKMCSHLAT